MTESVLKRRLYWGRIRLEERRVVSPHQPEAPLAKADVALVERSRAVRVATYGGQGIPVQLPWVTPVLGLGSVLDLFGDFSETAIALTVLGVCLMVVHIEYGE